MLGYFFKPLLASGDGEGWWEGRHWGHKHPSVRKNDSSNFSFPPGFPLQTPGVKKSGSAGSGAPLPHFGRAGGEGGGPAAQWQIMQILAKRGIHRGGGRGTRLIHLRIGLRRASPPPTLGRNDIRAAPSPWKSAGLISGRNRRLLPITAPRSRPATPGDRSWLRHRRQDRGQPLLGSVRSSRNPRVRGGSCILNAVPSRGLNRSSRLLALEKDRLGINEMWLCR